MFSECWKLKRSTDLEADKPDYGERSCNTSQLTGKVCLQGMPMKPPPFSILDNLRRASCAHAGWRCSVSSIWSSDLSRCSASPPASASTRHNSTRHTITSKQRKGVGGVREMVSRGRPACHASGTLGLMPSQSFNLFTARRSLGPSFGRLGSARRAVDAVGRGGEEGGEGAVGGRGRLTL